MNPDRWRKIEQIFAATLDTPASDRDSFLRSVCGDDTELHSEIKAMLRAHDQTGAGIFAKPLRSISADLLRCAAGDQVDRYIIARPLGTGGMGQIYEARDPRLDRRVALKLLSPDAFPTVEMSDRFHREARAASALNHPNVITVLDFHSSPTPFLVTEFVEGETLRHRIPLSLDEANDVLRQLATALRAVHEAGICHRDIKPENVMIRPDGLVKLIDFGLARLPRASSSFQTESGTVMGTFAYMAPEQLAGLETDASSDIWSFGVLAEELVGEAEAWKPIIKKCLQRDPSQRYANGAALMPAVHDAIQRRTRRALIMAGGAAFITSAAGAAVWSLRRPKALVIRGMAPLTDRGDVLRYALSSDHRLLALVCGLEGGQALISRHLPSGSDVTLMPLSPARFSGLAVSPDGNFVYASWYSGKSVATLMRFPFVGGEPILVATDVDSSVAFDPTGKRMVFVRRTPTASLLVMADPSSQEKERVLIQQSVQDPFSRAGSAWSPNGRTIAVPAGFQSRMLLIDAASGSIREMPGERYSYLSRPAWRNDSTLVFSLSRSPAVPAQLHEADVQTGATTRLTNDLSAYFDPTVSGSSIIARRQDFFSYLSVVPGPNRLSFGREQFSHVGWAGPDRLVLSGRSDNRYDLWLFHISKGRRTRITDDTSSERNPCWSETAQRFAVFSDRDGEWNLWTCNEDGRDWRQLTWGKTGGMYPDWTPDGKQIVFQSTRDGISGVWLVLADGSGEPRRLIPGVVRFPAVSPDGSLVACQTEDENKRWRLGLVDLSTGKPRPEQIVETQLYSPARWQRDGKGVVWVQRAGRASEFWISGVKPRVLRRVPDEEGTVTSFDINAAGAMAWLTGVSQNDIIRLET